MRRFSERHGYVPMLERMAPETVTAELRNLLWNVINLHVNHHNYELVTYQLWHAFYKKPVDERPTSRGFEHLSYRPAWQRVREHFFDAEWYVVYDYLEFFCKNNHVRESLINQTLEKEGAPYRLINGDVTPITDPAEIEAIEQGLSQPDRFSAVAAHLNAALMHLSARSAPDFRNSVKESICAVESAAKILTGKDNATLGDALRLLRKQGHVDTALALGFEKIYGWSSGPDGIRHGMLDDPNLTLADAKFFLVACSAFINYLKSTV